MRTWQQWGLRPLVRIVFTSLLYIVALPPHITSAQPATSTAPPTSDRFQWTVLGETTLYVEGGTSSTSFFALDLTKSFKDINAPWTTLAPGPNAVGQTMFLSGDRTKVNIWDGSVNVITTYNIATNQWQTGTPLTGLLPSSSGSTPAVLDPDTNTVYLLNGYVTTSPGSTTSVVSMMAYNISTGVVTSIATPTYIDPTWNSYAAVWSTVRKAIIFQGGLTGASAATMVASGNFYQYVPATNTWSNITGTGDHAGKLARHCMVSAYGGTKLVLFGGIDTTLHETGQLHFLDLTTMVWTAGTNSISARSSMACAVAGDSFLVWGGSANSTVVSNTPLIYNMRTNLWVNQFDPPSQTTTTPAGGSVGGSPPSVTNTSPPDTSSSHGSNVGAIGGGVGAGIALIAIIAALIIFRRRKAKRQNIKDGNGLTAGEKALELRLLVDGRDRCDQSPPLQGSRLQPQPSPQPPLLSPPILAPRPLSYGISIVDRSPVSHQHLVSAAEPPPPPRHTSGSVSSTRSLTNPNSPVIYMPLPTPRTVYDQVALNNSGSINSQVETVSPRSPQLLDNSLYMRRSDNIRPQNPQLRDQEVGVSSFSQGARSLSPSILYPSSHSTSLVAPSRPHTFIADTQEQQSAQGLSTTTMSPLSVRDSISTVMSTSAEAPLTKSDLAKKQLALLQIEHDVQLAKLKIAQELKMRQMEEDLR